MQDSVRNPDKTDMNSSEYYGYRAGLCMDAVNDK